MICPIGFVSATYKHDTYHLEAHAIVRKINELVEAVNALEEKAKGFDNWCNDDKDPYSNEFLLKERSLIARVLPPIPEVLDAWATVKKHLKES